MESKKSKDAVKLCNTCGSKIAHGANTTAYARRVYCSRACTNDRLRAQLSTDISCKKCGVAFIKKGTKPPKNFRARKFCSKRCAALFNKAKSSELRANGFWRRVEIKATNECWPWLGQIKNTRYGALRWHGKMESAHRIAFVLSKHAITPGMHVLHSCDNPPCCNPSHLREGNHRDNMDDIIARSRQPRKDRDTNPAAKINLEEWRLLVDACRALPRDRYGRVVKGVVPKTSAQFKVSQYIVKRAITEANRTKSTI